jgi:phenylacetate-CoA ligase
VRLILKRLWGALPEPVKLGRAYRQTAGFLDRTEHWSAGDWERYRLDRLKSILAHAGERVPYYRNLFWRLGFSPRDLSETTQLSCLPMVDKELVRSEPQRFTAQDMDTSDCVMLVTRGTSGPPHRFPYPRDLYNRECAFRLRLWARVGFWPGERLTILRAEPLAQDRIWSADPRWNARVFSLARLSVANLGDFLIAMRRWNARYLLACPSTVDRFYRLIHSAGMEPPRFSALLLTSECLRPHVRRFLERVGDTRVFTWYGHTERLLLAGECEESVEYHEEPAYGFTELVNAAGQPITRPGEPGEIVGTTFDNTAFALIRYRTGDRAEWSPTACTCGRPHRILVHLVGHAQPDDRMESDTSAVPALPETLDQVGVPGRGTHGTAVGTTSWTTARTGDRRG